MHVFHPENYVIEAPTVFLINEFKGLYCKVKPNVDEVWCFSYLHPAEIMKFLQVCFCNVIKRARDNVNNLWVAEATENSTYYLNYDHSDCSHLKDAGASAERWAKISGLVRMLASGQGITYQLHFFKLVFFFYAET